MDIYVIDLCTEGETEIFKPGGEGELHPSKRPVTSKSPTKKNLLGLAGLILDSLCLRRSKTPKYLISIKRSNYQINDYIRDAVFLLNSSGVAILITSLDITAFTIFEENN